MLIVERLIFILAVAIFTPVLLGVAAGTLYLYGYGIWWVSVTGMAYVIGLFQ